MFAWWCGLTKTVAEIKTLTCTGMYQGLLWNWPVTHGGGNMSWGCGTWLDCSVDRLSGSCNSLGIDKAMALCILYLSRKYSWLVLLHVYPHSLFQKVYHNKLRNFRVASPSCDHQIRSLAMVNVMSVTHIISYLHLHGKENLEKWSDTHVFEYHQ